MIIKEWPIIVLIIWFPDAFKQNEGVFLVYFPSNQTLYMLLGNAKNDIRSSCVI
ncbi:hypothetical protein Patl1_19364 [Pistacia atlantica]|uniref:Uncharacterized protein n=1 Tax=Pistacia atlantica TaxID=434234 RepID=A0ACC1C1X6_9ROSI|nr:hypothetical protein Patl1_19364 [Pistacia atlantica]